MAIKKIIYKISPYLFIALVFLFFGKNIVDNWEKIKDYDFSFNYFYLFSSLVFFISTIIIYSFIWNRILRKLENQIKLSNFKALKIFIFSWFGRYLPGKFWMFLGRIYLGAKEGIDNKKLTVSVLFDIVLSITAAFIFSLVLLTVTFGAKFSDYYFLPIVAILGGLIFAHPKIFYPLGNFALRKIKKAEIPKEDFLSYSNIIKFIFSYMIAYTCDGFGFFLLINSITDFPFHNILGLIGIFIFSAVIGAISVFPPAGLGVREGFLVMFLQFYFPISVAILISLIARVAVSVGEVFLYATVYFISKFKKI